mgnify:CR=1 FL=1
MNDPWLYKFDITPIDVDPTPRQRLGWYTLDGFSDRGAAYRLVCDSEGKKLTYYRPANWTDEDWDEFCNEMEEDVRGTEAD